MGKINFYQLLKDVNQDRKKIKIISELEENNAVLISLDDWHLIQETLIIEQTGVLDEVKKRVKNDSGFTKVNDIYLDKL